MIIHYVVIIKQCMKKVLYITNIETPYRVAFFNELSQYCDLTVLYERKKSKNRDDKWAHKNIAQYNQIFLKGINCKNESVLSLQIVRHVFEYETVIVGSYNSPSQMLAIMVMRICGKKYYLNLDGENFVNKKTLKGKAKKFFLSGAEKYFVAGELSAKSLKEAIGKEVNTIPYYFSSLKIKELEKNSETKLLRKKFILVIGQYFPYKGLDIAVEVAKKMPDRNFIFVGMGSRTDVFIKECGIKNSSNIKIIPFLEKEKLDELYASCEMLLLPSRQECWGLVINEAASFGTPIVATKGSGAAIEFLEEYPQFLVDVSCSKKIVEKIEFFEKMNEYEIDSYKKYLIEKSKKYNIERSARIIGQQLGGEHDRK